MKNRQILRWISVCCLLFISLSILLHCKIVSVDPTYHGHGYGHDDGIDGIGSDPLSHQYESASHMIMSYVDTWDGRRGNDNDNNNGRRHRRDQEELFSDSNADTSTDTNTHTNTHTDSRTKKKGNSKDHSETNRKVMPMDVPHSNKAVRSYLRKDGEILSSTSTSASASTSSGSGSDGGSNLYSYSHSRSCVGDGMTLLNDILAVADSYHPNDQQTTSTSNQNRNRNHPKRRIPSTIHIIVRDKCMPSKDAEAILNAWVRPFAIKSSPSSSSSKSSSSSSLRYSIQFHDEIDATREILVKHRASLPNIGTTEFMDCLVTSEFKTELVKLLLLWDVGGIVVDAGTIMPTGKLIEMMIMMKREEVDVQDGANDDEDDGNVSITSEIYEGLIQMDDEAIVFLHQQQQRDDGSTTSDSTTTSDSKYAYVTDFMAVKPRHPIIYMMIQQSMSNIFQQVSNETFILQSANARRSSSLEFLLRYSFPNVADVTEDEDMYNGIASRLVMTGVNSSVTVLNITTAASGKYLNFLDEDRMNHTLGMNTSSIWSTMTSLPASNSTCVNWGKFQNKIDMPSLEKLVKNQGGDDSNSDSNGGIVCPKNQTAIIDNIIPIREFSSNNRKIPKVIHVTSKSRCMTKEYTEVVNSWRFYDYSLVLHDDDAVQRLLSREWPEFPLLHNAAQCITSGAGRADLWRYLVLWEYGGIYTDIDNAPGPWFQNGTIIEDHMDGFLEVEVGRFPSQYFIAVSPHHSLMYMAVQNAIQRLFHEQNVAQQYVPFVTGPGAMKWAMHYTVGNAYHKKGTHPTFDGKHITLVGNRTTAMKRYYINRGKVKNKDHYKSMNMTHYSYAERKPEPRIPCVQLLYTLRQEDEDALLT